MNMLNEALLLATEHKFRVLPVKPPAWGGSSIGKVPLIKDWVRLATTNGDQIEKWWAQWPDANIGIATGKESGIFVLDVDVATGGLESAEQLFKQSAWPNAPIVRTGSGGLHFYFAYDGSFPLRNSVSELGPGLDIRCEGGYVVAPPSLHASGKRYEWID